MVMGGSSSRPRVRILPCLLAAGLVALAGSSQAQAPPGHHLPDGADRPVREREIDITDIKADLRFDMDQRTIAGTLTITLTPLRTGLRTFSLEAAELTIDRVEAIQPPGNATGNLEGRELRVTLPAPIDPGDVASVRIAYSCRPRTGMFFVPAVGSQQAEAWNYGEGGLHDAWLPLFNDTNDRFTASFDVTVATPYVALSNGRLETTRENSDGTRTFRWVQDKPIPNYLLTVDVGVFSSVSIGEAHLAGSTVPLAAWGPASRGPALTYTFGDTPKMVEFFSGRLGYPYPWAKYDQVVLREFAAGAMETTTMVGFTGGHLHVEGDPPDTAPNPGAAYPIWTSEDTISHELAHHWFGDLLTCRSLGSIWLNESFASFLHTVWNGHAHGEDDLTYQRWRYLNAYLDYVRRTGTVRPLEYLKYAAPDDMYQTETTYLKGALVLHMLRHVVGDRDFYRTLAAYLQRHAFGNVESVDLLQAFRDTTGRNLTWFFDDWIVVGGGHPSFDVSYSWDPVRKQVDLTVRQVQADLPFENDFRLPVDVEIVTTSGATTHTIQVSGWSTVVSLPAEERPSAVVFDKGGWLVADVRFARSLDELLRVLATGGLAERLRAARQLARDYPARAETVETLAGVLGDASVHWGLRQESALGLGRAGGEAAAAALVGALRDADRRVRRAAAVALRDRAGSEATDQALKATVLGDQAEDVVASAELSLGRGHGAGVREFLVSQLRRDSRWWDVIRAGALSGLAELEDPTLVSTFADYVGPSRNSDVRQAALAGWHRAAPEDPRLASTLRTLTTDPSRDVQLAAIGLLASLHRADDLPLFRELTAHPDPNIAALAEGAVKETEAFTAARHPVR